MISIIAALTKDRVIGKDNKMPWNLPEDLKNFKKITRGNTVIMGRKTYESIGRPLPKRKNIVLSSSMKSDKVLVCDSLESALESAKLEGKEIFIIGGAQVYEKALFYADRMYLSYVHETFEGDTYFPEFCEDDWHIKERKGFPGFDFVVYERKLFE